MESERRMHPRMPIAASVVLWKGEENLGTFKVLNLSAGGVLVGWDLPLRPGDKLGMMLRLPGDQTVHTLSVVRREEQPGTFAIAFVNLTPDAEDAIQDAVLNALDQVRSASVLIVDDSPQLCRALRAELERYGYNAFAVSTPLEAVRLLQDQHHVQVAFVDLILGTADGMDLLAYLAEEHPEVRRVLMSGRVQAAQLALARNTMLPFSAHEILPKPWTEGLLTRALG